MAGIGATEAGEAQLRAAALVDHDAGPVLGLEPRGRLLLEVEIAVEIALHHRHTVLEGEVEDAAPALGRQHRARGILERRDQIDELGPVAGERFLQRLDAHAIVIDRNADDVRAGPPEGEEGAGVGR
jgi:hypothetical protein